MRIALVCDWYSPRLGGIESHLTELGRRLVAVGHSVHVITSTPGPSGPSATGVEVHRMSASRIPFAGVVFQPSAIREIGAILDRQRIELVHAHVSIVAPVGIGGAYEATRRRLPAVVTFHSFVPATPLWASIVGRLVGASTWNATMTAVSSVVAREVGAFTAARKMRVLPNAIDVDFWMPGPEKTPADSVSLVAVTRLRSKKRPMLLIDAAREIRRRLPDARFVLRIAGSGPLERSMRRVVEREGLGNIVEFVGWRDPEELRALLRESDGFLSPTVREAFGLAALEARAVGLPVIAMSRSAVADFVRHDESGLLAASDDDFIDACVRLVRDASLRRRIATHNRCVRPDLTWERSILAHEAAYADAGRRAARMSPGY